MTKKQELQSALDAVNAQRDALSLKAKELSAMIRAEDAREQVAAMSPELRAELGKALALQLIGDAGGIASGEVVSGLH